MADSTNKGDANAALRSMRKERAVGVPTSHLDQAGIPTSARGNDQAPFVWSPPFRGQLQPWKKYAGTVADHLPYSPAPLHYAEPVDVADYRIVTVAFSYTPGSATALMGLIPLVTGLEYTNELLGREQALGADPYFWFPLGFVWPNPTSVAAPGVVSPFNTTYVQRTIEPMSFYTRPGVLFPTVMALDFDVSSYDKFTCVFWEEGDDDANSALQAYYSRRT